MEFPKVLPKPNCPLIGQDDNIFNLLGIAASTLRQNEMPNEAKEMRLRVSNSSNYGEALAIISDMAKNTYKKWLNCANMIDWFIDR